MATHSSVPAWRIPWTQEPGGLCSTGSQSQTGLKRLSTQHTHLSPFRKLPASSMREKRSLGHDLSHPHSLIYEQIFCSALPNLVFNRPEWHQAREDPWKLKLQYFGHLLWRTDIRKDPDAGKDWRQEEKGRTEDEMVGWHHRLNGHEFEQAPGVRDGQGGLACCSPWGHKESDTTVTELNWRKDPNWSLPDPRGSVRERCFLRLEWRLQAIQSNSFSSTTRNTEAAQKQYLATEYGWTAPHSTAGLGKSSAGLAVVQKRRQNRGDTLEATCAKCSVAPSSASLTHEHPGLSITPGETGLTETKTAYPVRIEVWRVYNQFKYRNISHAHKSLNYDS